MTNKNQATPRPWNYSQYGNQIQIYSERYNDKGEKFALPDLICRYELVGNANNKSNAQIIVKAVNCHDELLGALEAVSKCNRGEGLPVDVVIKMMERAI